MTSIIKEIKSKNQMTLKKRSQKKDLRNIWKKNAIFKHQKLSENLSYV